MNGKKPRLWSEILGYMKNLYTQLSLPESSSAECQMVCLMFFSTLGKEALLPSTKKTFGKEGSLPRV